MSTNVVNTVGVGCGRTGRQLVLLSCSKALTSLGAQPRGTGPAPRLVTALRGLISSPTGRIIIGDNHSRFALRG